MDNHPIDILILTHNRQRYLEKMIRSLQKYTKYPHRLIIIDNASSTTTIDYLKMLEQQQIIHKLVLNSENLFMDGWHKGVDFIKSDLFAISDPDIVVPNSNPDWLSTMVCAFDLFPNLVRLGVSLDDKNLPPCWNKFEGRFLTFQTGKIFSKKPCIRLSTPDTTLQVIRTDIFKKAGGFSKKTIDFSFLKTLSNYGICGTHQEIKGYHLGWNEYKDYPEYLYKKNLFRPCREATLLKTKSKQPPTDTKSQPGN